MSNSKKRMFTLILFLVTVPLLLLYIWLLLDSFTEIPSGSIFPVAFDLDSWSFLYENIPGHPSVWKSTLNTFIFAALSTAIVVFLSITSGYAFSRLRFPYRGFFLSTVLILHSFPSITLLIAIFIILQLLGLYDSLTGVILVKASLELPLGIWLMKGFYDSVPWEIETTGVVEGASRFQVWLKLILPQVMPGIAALAIFSFIAGWSEYILPLVFAPSADIKTLSTFMASLVSDDSINSDYGMLHAVGLFYMMPVLIFYLFSHKKLMNVYAGGTKGY